MAGVLAERNAEGVGRVTYEPIPDNWADEPWPLDEPDIGTMRVTNRSDSYDQVPQVADLADEAWQYAIDHGLSLERALVEVQGQRFHTGGVVSNAPRITFVPNDPGAVVDLSTFTRELTIQFTSDDPDLRKILLGGDE